MGSIEDAKALTRTSRRRKALESAGHWLEACIAGNRQGPPGSGFHKPRGGSMGPRVASRYQLFEDGVWRPRIGVCRRNWVEPREHASRPDGEGHFLLGKGVVDLSDDDGTIHAKVTVAGDRRFHASFANAGQGEASEPSGQVPFLLLLMHGESPRTENRWIHGMLPGG
jgi:hypothetical protein